MNINNIFISAIKIIIVLIVIVNIIDLLEFEVIGRIKKWKK